MASRLLLCSPTAITSKTFSAILMDVVRDLDTVEMAAIVAVSITMLILENKAIGHKMMAECHWIWRPIHTVIKCICYDTRGVTRGVDERLVDSRMFPRNFGRSSQLHLA